MGTDGDQRELLTTALAEFLTEGALPEQRGVPNHVAASWRRSVSRGVQPDVVENDYYSELDVDSRLVRCARPEIEHLAEQISAIPACVALTDDRARILGRSDTGPGFGRVLDHVYFAQGFGYAENTVGTNGVGTVLEFGESVHIVGAEHFVELLHPFACAGAPVRDPFTGRIEGVLDISCQAQHSHPMLHTLVRTAASRIERNLLLDRDRVPQALFDAYSRVDARTRGAVLAVGPRMVTANTAMQTLLDGPDQEVLREHARFLMHGRAAVDDRIDLPSGARVRMRGSTVRVGGDVAGLVCVVSVLDEIDARPAAPQVRAPRTGLAPSSSPAWLAAAQTVEGALRDGSPVVVLGEPGSGRRRLLCELFSQVGGRAVPVPADRIEAGPAEAVTRLRGDSGDATGCAVLPVLCDLDRLSPETVAALHRELQEPGRPVVAATCSGTVPEPLLGLFRVSAAVPALRHRGGDVAALAASLLGDLTAHRDVRLSRDAERLLTRHRWPGNVAQLRDALADALRRRPVGVIEAADLPASCQSTPRSTLRPVDEVERDAIVAAIREAGGNRKAAAAALGLARSTLYRKIRQYGIDC
ncbi:sigma-54-dependent Fis family transcriptional regulator [Pseudonocardia endophytica]|uniref:Transcriptional regulator of acetoin/glycerol metabolism n=1 Tax=Pseudonocardia endophytica TaxID=401976 RepID=A0A4R1HG85_PSEEN|nr:helix-turn-helix domain-containing protein [Pseudonocardia endophytica]TCK21174.1 transcriptional regulator of acetoin/glycerol metabolism [Pseudonocardia endophytica]